MKFAAIYIGYLVTAIVVGSYWAKIVDHVPGSFLTYLVRPWS